MTISDAKLRELSGAHLARWARWLRRVGFLTLEEVQLLARIERELAERG